MTSHGELIKKQIDRRGLIQSHVAADLDMDRHTLNNIISGRRNMPARAMPKASEILHIDEDVLWLTSGRVPPDVIATILAYPKLINLIRRHARYERDRKGIDPR